MDEKKSKQFEHEKPHKHFKENHEHHAVEHENNLHKKIEELTKKNEELEKSSKEFEEKAKNLENEVQETKSKLTQYLNTASYYKNESENIKKDFDRFKERNKNIEVDAKQKASESVAKKLLPIIDNFDQAISTVDPEIMRGFSMIYSSLCDVLTDLGVIEIKCGNEKLNPEIHNCINTEPTEDENLDGNIAKVYQKGYMFAESKTVIRPATVSVYKK